MESPSRAGEHPRGGRTRGPFRLMDRMDAKLAKDLPDRRVAELAGRQHGVVARRQLISMGIGRGAIEARVCAGRLIRVHRGVFAVGHARLTNLVVAWPESSRAVSRRWAVIALPRSRGGCGVSCRVRLT